MSPVLAVDNCLHLTCKRRGLSSGESRILLFGSIVLNDVFADFCSLRNSNIQVSNLLTTPGLPGTPTFRPSAQRFRAHSLLAIMTS